MIYKLYKTQSGIEAAVGTFNNGNQVSFLFDPANTDYQTFKAQILSEEAELQDQNGDTLTPQEAKAFVATLP